MKQEYIDRINILAKKSKEQELTPEEKEEQKTLREAYIKAVKNNFEYQLQELIKDKN